MVLYIVKSTWKSLTGLKKKGTEAVSLLRHPWVAVFVSVLVCLSLHTFNFILPKSVLTFPVHRSGRRLMRCSLAAFCPPPPSTKNSSKLRSVVGMHASICLSMHANL